MKVRSDSETLSVNVEAIAAGIADMIEDHPHGGCVTLGMLPADLMRSFETALERKVSDAEARRRISREVSGAVLTECRRRGWVKV